jgi:hypothetical protein
MYSRRKFLNLSTRLLWASGLPSAASAAAQDGGVAAPRVALVIGNSSYRSSPLQNPVHDATAIDKTLTNLGFQCKLLINANLKDMAAAVQSHGEILAKLKAVGLFYYAGHGAQLAWRNYLVPVDASISSLEDLPKQSLELNSLLMAVKKAANPMNVIILDACRDNPFGTKVPLEQKGLSQFDAPTGSLLSYATAPGNTASDGDGENGLFTECLLREMRVPGAKLEDIFKRVRLQVRLKSKGQQVPWESTSLEQDFYFVRSLEKSANLSDEQKEALFLKEATLWNVVKDSGTPELFSTYLTLYPDGSFAQLAQISLDRLLRLRGEKKVEIAPAVSNPFTKGTSRATGQYAIGDRYNYEQRDAISNAVELSYQEVVSEVRETEIIFNAGELVLDLMGNEIKSQISRISTATQIFAAEYSVGSNWNTRFGWLWLDGSQISTVIMEMRVISRQAFSTPAGDFNAFKVYGDGRVSGGGARVEITYWIDPERCNRPLMFEMLTKSSGKAGFRFALRNVLVGFSQRSNLAFVNANQGHTV